MARPGGEGLRRPVGWAVLATVLAPLALFVAVRGSAYEATEFRTDLSGVLPPSSPMTDVRRVMRPARRLQPELPRDAATVAARGARAYPLAFEPYFIAARVQERAGRYDEATRLMEEARRRRPNHAPTRVSLLGYYSLANAYQQAIDEADVAMRVNANTSTRILPAFARLVAVDEKARRAIGVALARGPAWEADFFRVAGDAGMDPADAFALVAEIRRASGGQGDRRAQDGFLVQSLVRAGRFAEARRYWLQTQAQAGAADNAVVDPRFTNAAAGPPFGWKLNQTEAGVAERARASRNEPAYLEVSFFGSAPAELAEQLLVLRPGRYRIVSRASVQGGGEEAYLSWRLLCATGGDALGLLRLTQGSAGPASSTPFTVPAECRAQRLVLAGTPGDLPRTMSAQIQEVRVIADSQESATR